MSEHYPGTASAVNWDDHYDSRGPAKKDARELVYSLREGGKLLVDIEDNLARVLLESIKINQSATVVDVGCSYPPSFLQLLRILKHAGPLIGIEPNTEQLNGRPYWEPRQNDPTYDELLLEGDAEKIYDYYQQHTIPPTTGDGADNLGIQLLKANANFLPLPDGSVDVMAYILSFYHVPKDKQFAAIREGKRTLREGGMAAFCTSGEKNKEGLLHEMEQAITRKLQRKLGRIVTPPPAISSGFTTEDGLLALPDHYQYVYVQNKVENLIARNDTPVILNMYRSLWDMWRDQNGNKIPSDDFEKALQQVVYSGLGESSESNPIIIGRSHRSIIIASDHQQPLPSTFQLIS